VTSCDIVVAGHLCLDVTPKFRITGARSLAELLRPGSLVHVDECVISTGGPVSNTGISLNTIGAHAVLMGKVGDDAFGRVVIEKMRERGFGDGIQIVPGEQTSYTIVIAPPGVDRVFLHNPGANNTYGADDVDYSLLDGARAFHFGYPPLMERMYRNGGAELIEMFKRAKQRGVTTSLDMSLPDPRSAAGQTDWDAILRKLLPFVDVFLPSAEEMLLFLERAEFLRKMERAAAQGEELLRQLEPADYSRLAGRLIEYGAGVVTLKSGYRGIYVRTAGPDRLRRFGRATVGDLDDWSHRELWEPAFHVDAVVSATGSGDSAIAGFLASFLRHESLEDALRYATAAGRQNVLVHDATSGIRSFEHTRAELPSLRKSALDIDAEGWRRDEQGQRWIGPGDGRPSESHA